MNQFFSFLTDLKRSTVQIDCDLSFKQMEEYTTPSCTKRIPYDVVFKVVKGKRFYDIIEYYGACFEFYSERIINVLSRYIDMTDKCYPLNIEDAEMQYYCIYNLKEAFYFNIDFSKRSLEEETDRFLFPENDIPNLFCFNDSWIIVIPPEIKEKMERQKITNINFIECLQCDEQEYSKWKKKHKISKDVRYQRWFNLRNNSTK